MMIIRSEQFSRYSGYIVLFGMAGFSIKFLSLTKTSIVEFSDKANPSIVIGALSFIVLYSTAASIACAIRDYRQTQLADYGDAGPGSGMDFSTPAADFLATASSQYIAASKFMFWVDVIFPILFGLIILSSTHKELWNFCTFCIGLS